MKDLPDDLTEALSAFAAKSELSPQEALERILREWLTRNGYLAHGDDGIHPEDLNASNDD